MRSRRSQIVNNKSKGNISLLNIQKNPSSEETIKKMRTYFFYDCCIFFVFALPNLGKFGALRLEQPYFLQFRYRAGCSHCKICHWWRYEIRQCFKNRARHGKADQQNPTPFPLAGCNQQLHPNPLQPTPIHPSQSQRTLNNCSKHLHLGGS